MTLAPISASIAPALGAAIQLSISITVISSSGAGTISPETVNLVGKANTTWCNCLNTENLARNGHKQGIPMKAFDIRVFHPADMPMLYQICLETGASGSDATGSLDRDILGHIYAAPYVIFEPELCFVLTLNGRVCGYILGTSDSQQFATWCETKWWPTLRQAYPLAAQRVNLVRRA
jgi:hypothetical protein